MTKRFSSSAALAGVRFFTLAVALHVLLQVPGVRDTLVARYTQLAAAGSAAVLRLVHPSTVCSGVTISDPHFSVTVRSVCNGSDVLVLFTAAVLTCPLPWRARLTGMAIGLPALALLNLGRIMGLFLIGRYASWLFHASHLFIGQAVMVLCAVALFALYLRWGFASASRWKHATR